MTLRGSLCTLTLVLLAGTGLTRATTGSSLRSPQNAPPSPPAESTPQAARLPLYFEANRGQWKENIRFRARAGSGILTFTEGEIQLAAAPGGKRRAMLPSPSHAVSMRLPRGRQGVSPVAATPAPGRIHYLIGNDPRRWIRHVPTYTAIRYPQVFPAIDLVFHSDAGGPAATGDLEYDFVVAPGGNPDQIRYGFGGLSGSPRLDARGDLILPTREGEMRHRRPVCYQELDGIRKAVTGSYRLCENGEIGFAVGPYDRNRQLVIDPVVLWDAYIKGAGTGNLSLARDTDGNLYFGGGVVESSGLPTTTGSFQLGYNGGNSDCFVGSLTPDGSQLRYLTFLGGSGDEGTGGDRIDGPAIAVNTDRQVWITGSTRSENFPVTQNAFQFLKPGYNPDFQGGAPNYDAFVSQLSSDGSTLHYSTYLGGTGDYPAEMNSNDYGVGIGVRSIPSGIMGGTIDEVFVVGSTASSAFPTAGNVYRAQDPNACRGSGPIGSNTTDVFAVKMREDGTIVASTYIGAPPSLVRDPDTNQVTGCFAPVSSIATAMALEARGDVYITGYTDSNGLNYDPIIRFPVGSNALQTVPQGGFDGFVIIFDNDLRDFYYSTLLGGQDDDFPNAVAVNNAGHFAVGGSTESNNFPTQNTAYPTFLGGTQDGFVTTFDFEFHPVFSTYMGGTQGDLITGITVNSAGAVTAVGVAGNNQVPRIDDITGTGSVGSGFITTWNNTGTMTRSSYLSGVGANGSALGHTNPYAVLTDTSGNAWVAGYATQTGALKSLQRYTYGQSPASSPIFIARIGSGPPAAPSGLTATPFSSKEIDLVWTDNSSDETSFRVEVRAIGTTQFSEVASVGTGVTSTRIGNLLAKKGYEFRVRAHNGLYSDYSNAATAVTLAAPRIQVTPRTINFGTVRTGRLPVQRVFRIRNIGAGPLKFNVGTPAAPFSLAGGPGELQPRKTLAVFLKLEATAPGQYRQTFTITSDDPRTPSITVTAIARVR